MQNNENNPTKCIKLLFSRVSGLSAYSRSSLKSYLAASSTKMCWLCCGLHLTWCGTGAEGRCQDENEWDVYHPEKKDGLGAKKWSCCGVWGLLGLLLGKNTQSWHKIMQYFPEPEIPYLFSESNPWLISAPLLTYITGTCLRFLFIIFFNFFFF